MSTYMVPRDFSLPPQALIPADETDDIARDDEWREYCQVSNTLDIPVSRIHGPQSRETVSVIQVHMI